jgi:hypothetical protein
LSSDIGLFLGVPTGYEYLGTAGESNNTGRSGTSVVSGSAIMRFQTASSGYL